MAGERNAVEVVIRTRNEASTGLAQFASDLEHSHRGIGRFAEAINALNPPQSPGVRIGPPAFLPISWVAERMCRCRKVRRCMRHCPA
jgi:hypothetical protein